MPKAGHRLRAGDRVLSPVRGRVQRYDSWADQLLVESDVDGSVSRHNPRHVFGADRERVCRCRTCGMWKHVSRACDVCALMAEAPRPDAPDEYGERAH